MSRNWNITNCGVAILATSLLLPSDASAQEWLFFDPYRLTTEVNFDGNNHENDGVLTGRSLELEERIHIEQSGFIIDPAIARFTVHLEPTFRQSQQESPGEKSNPGGRTLNYQINLEGLRGANSPVSLLLALQKNSNVNDSAFGSRIESDESVNALDVLWDNRVFPLKFNFVDTKIKRVSSLQSNNQSILRNEKRKRYRVSGRSSKLNVLVESEDVNDLVSNRDLDYRRNRVETNHRLNWGRGSNLYSLFRYHDRTGSNENSTLELNETARIVHTENLRSRVNYRYTARTTTEKSTSQLFDFGIEHNLYNNLVSSIDMSRRSDQSTRLDRNEYSLRGSLGYNKRLPIGTFAVSLSEGLGNVDQQSEGGRESVVNEPHLASFVNPIILSERLVYVKSIVVIDATDGFIYSESIDYQTSLLGGLLGEIRIIPDGRIAPETQLWIGYEFELQPSSEYQRRTRGQSLSLSSSWFRVYYEVSSRDHNLRDGPWPVLPPDEKSTTAGLELNWNPYQFRLRFAGQQRDQRIGDFESELLTLTQVLTYSHSARLNLAISANHSEIENNGAAVAQILPTQFAFRSAKAKYQTLDFRLSWRSRGNMTIEPSLGVWSREEQNTSSGNVNESSGNVDERYFSAKLMVRWQIRKLAMEFLYSHNVVDSDRTNRVVDRFFARVSRTF